MNGLDLLAAEAARLFGVSVAWVGLLRDDGEQVIASVGTRRALIPLELSIAARVREATDVVIIADTKADEAFGGHPLVIKPPHISFIASVPLFDAVGRFAGALSMIDKEPRNPAPELIEMLRIMGRQVAIQLHVREELDDASDRFHDFFEQTADLLLSLAPDGTILHANETAIEVLGVIRGGRLEQHAEPEKRAELAEALSRTFSRAEPVRVETVFLSPGRGRIILEGWLRPKLIAGVPMLARVVFRDVTDRKQFENELANARDAALEAARMKTAFLANVSHEIRTPMNGIIGMVDLLLASPSLNAEQQDFAHQARASAEQLLSVVSNILYISNLQAGSLGAHQVDFDVQAAMLRIVEVMKVAALGKDLTIRFSYGKNVPPILRGNQSKVRQIVGNLMENAVRFTTAGEVALDVSLETETETHRVVRFEVRDTGIGIPEEDRLLLFERFSQVESSSTRRYPGAGLGLATARHLVETMGGLIDVDSTPGKGSTFWFTIPFRNVAANSRPIASSDFDLRGKRALLLDRRPDSQRVIRHYLGDIWEMRTDVTSRGEEALAALRTASRSGDPYRLVVFEAVPDLEPCELAHAVRNDPQTATAGLIQLVPASDRNATEEATLRERGIDAWTYKPIGQRDLFDAIAIAMARQAVSLPHVETQATGSGVTSVAPLAPEALKILLAEDNFLNMKLTVSQLRQLGMDADTVTNGREAVAAVQRQSYDVILMDCQMPIMDGYEATGEIRRLEREGMGRHRIIAMTANALEGDRERCLAAGMDDYLSKPTHYNEIDQALRRWRVAMPS